MRTATKLLKLWPYRTLIARTLQPGDPVTLHALSVWTKKQILEHKISTLRKEFNFMMQKLVFDVP
jgi:hypothetical protein